MMLWEQFNFLCLMQQSLTWALHVCVFTVLFNTEWTSFNMSALKQSHSPSVHLLLRINNCSHGLSSQTHVKRNFRFNGFAWGHRNMWTVGLSDLGLRCMFCRYHAEEWRIRAALLSVPIYGGNTANWSFSHWLLTDGNDVRRVCEQEYEWSFP